VRADNSRYIMAAAQRRSQKAQQQAAVALRRLGSAGLAINFDVVAREAGVSRSWLYTQPHLRAEIERLRQRQPSSPGRITPDRQRASDPSLKARLTLAHERIRELQAENRRLRAALAEAIGVNRATASSTGASPTLDLRQNSGSGLDRHMSSVDDGVRTANQQVTKPADRLA
jgi:hypothetical protein